MQTLTTLPQLVETVHDRQRKLEPVDRVERIDKYEFRFPEDQAARMVALAGGSDRSLELSDHALGQILGRASVPGQFFRRCPTNLKWAIANHFIQSGGFPKESMLRLVQGDRVRAALSESYTAFDDADVVPMIADVLADEDCQVQADFADEFTHIRVTFPRTDAEVRVGDVVRAGLHITNSEVGSRAVHIDSLVYRLVCTNGLVSSDYASRAWIRHVGNPARIKDYVRQAVADAREGSRELIQRFKASVDHALADPEKLLERHGKEHDLTQGQLQAALAAFAQEGDRTLFGAVNAITAAARQEPTWERRYQVERVGAALLRRAG